MRVEGTVQNRQESSPIALTLPLAQTMVRVAVFILREKGKVHLYTPKDAARITEIVRRRPARE
jgi:hypothetical protein